MRSEPSVEGKEKIETDGNKIVSHSDIQNLGGQPKETGFKRTPQVDILGKADEVNIKGDLYGHKAALNRGEGKQVDSEGNFRTTQELIMERDTDLNKLAHTLYFADIAKLMLEDQDLNHQIKKIKNAIAKLGRNKSPLTHS